MKKNKTKTISVKMETEYLSKDILEEDFINVFSKFLTVQMILGISHVEAKDRFVTAPTLLQKLYSIVIRLVSLPFYLLCAYHYVKNYHYTLMIVLMSSNFIILAIFYVSICLNSRFVDNDGNVQFYVHMQKIDRIMRIEHNTVIYSMMRKWNFITLVSYLAGLVILILGACLDQGLAIMYLGFFIPFVTCPIEVGYGSNLIIHFFIRVRFINAILLNYIEGKGSVVKKPKSLVGYPTKERIRYLATETHDFETSDTDVYLREILECYQKFQDLYRLPIGFWIAYAFILIFLACQFIYYSLLKNELLLRDFIGAFTFVVFGLTDVVFLCLRCDLFLEEVKQMKKHVIAILSVNTEGPLRSKAKRMLQMVAQAPLQFSIYDMWEVDNKFMVNSLGHVTDILFNVLQLNFLR